MRGDYVSGTCHEWREISRGMVTLGLEERKGYRCAECGAWVASAFDMSAAPKCVERLIPRSWLPQKTG